MKFGDQLKQRSIPEWAYYNVDYHEVKHIIKAKTSITQVKPLTIPGQGADIKECQDLENELYTKLCEEHDRANLFVKSKYWEIQKKLNDLQKQILQIKQHPYSTGSPAVLARQKAKLSLLEGRISNVGTEVQSLQRFVGANLTAFAKLLKKYRRWTNSPDLGIRFSREVLNRRTSYLTNDTGPLLEIYTEVLTACREAHDERARPKLSSTTPRARSGVPKNASIGTTGTFQGESIAIEPAGDTSVSGQLFTASQNASDVDFDSALATLPLGTKAGRATYWVHQDNLIGLRVLLLEYTNTRTSEFHPSKSATAYRSSISSLQKAALSDNPGASGTIGDEVNWAIFDDVDRFSREQSAVTVGDVENAAGTVSGKATLVVRWSGQTDPVIELMQGKLSVVGASSPENHLKEVVKTARLRRKRLHALFDPEQLAPKSPLGEEAKSRAGAKNAESSEPLADMRAFITSHSEVKPLVQLQCKRTRFVGLNNRANFGLWVTLDTKVLIRRIDLGGIDTNNAMTRSESSNDTTAEVSSFPHAVLQLRWEGDYSTDLIKVLDHSHLVERVRGFSIETHAVATMCRPRGMPQPFWIPVLNGDIRKLPRISSLGSIRIDGTQASTECIDAGDNSASVTLFSNGPSSTGFSVPVVASSATSARDFQDSEPATPSPKRKETFPRNHYGSGMNGGGSSCLHRRYWNEYEDGNEVPENEPYSIFVDSNPSSPFPAAGYFSMFTSTIRNNIYSWVRPEATKEQDDTTRPLLGDHCNRIQVGVGSSDSDDVEAALGNHILEHDRRRSTIASRNRLNVQRSPASERSLFRYYFGAFTASFILLIITSFLTFTRRGKEAVQREIGVLVGVVPSQCFGIIGLSCMFLRKDNVGWLHRSVVLLAFGIVCVASGFLLSLIGHRA